MNHTPYSLFPLRDLAVLHATGADALAFLHGQLTQDIEGLPQGQARLAGYCTAKGRLLGSLVTWKTSGPDGETSLRAIVKADIAQALAKRLSMFILRAKVQIQVTDIPVYGLMQGLENSPGAAGALPGLDAASLAQLPAQPTAWTLAAVGAKWQAIAAPAAQDSRPRWWLIPAAALPSDTTDTDSGTLARNTAHWQVADIAAGMPWVQAATQDVFIPQTLNFDLIGGVNFTKGCYPGQEVVARAHYRGTVKRRMAYGTAAVQDLDAATLPGTDTFDARHPDSPCGRIVNAAQCGDTLHVLMETQLADLGQADFRLESAQGPAIEPRELPYGITAAQA